MQTLVVLKLKFKKSKKLLNFLLLILKYTKIWVLNLQKVLFFMVNLVQERLYLPKL